MSLITVYSDSSGEWNLIAGEDRGREQNRSVLLLVAGYSNVLRKIARLNFAQVNNT